MRLALFAATVFAMLSVVLFAGIATGSSAASPNCVAGVSVTRPTGLEAAAERLVPTSYAHLSSQGSVGWRGFGVVGLASLRIYHESGEFDAWPLDVSRAWHAVMKKCGANVADRAWAVFVEFPNCQIPCSHGTMYFTKTRSRWRLLWAD